MEKVVVIGPGSIFRAGLVSLLGTMGFDRTEPADDIAALRPMVGEQSHDVLLLVLLANLSVSIETVAPMVGELRAIAPFAKIVFLAERLDIELLSACFSAGANAYLLVRISRDALCESLRLVCTGEKVFPSELASLFPELTAVSGDAKISFSTSECKDLSSREAQILQCLTNGQSNKLIARNLDIAEATVKVHVKRILRKVHVANRTQAALWAISKGVAQPPARHDLAK